MPQKVELPPALIERITALFDAGQSRRKIATLLQEEGYVVPADSRRKTWHHSLVSTYLERLGLVSPLSWILKPEVLGEGAKRWEELLAAAPHTRPAGQRAVSAPAAAGPLQPAEAPPTAVASQLVERARLPSSAERSAPSLDLEALAAGWEHALARASIQPAEATSPAEPSGRDGPPKRPPPPAAASAPEPGGVPSLHIAVDGPCTPADRRLWFSLVRVARPELGHKPRHDLPRARALALLAPGPAAPGPADLWGALKRLRASGIIWEARFDGLPLLITTPLISGVLTTTALTFHFSPELVTLLLDDTQFARLRALLGREHDLPPATR